MSGDEGLEEETKHVSVESFGTEPVASGCCMPKKQPKSVLFVIKFSIMVIT